MANIKKLKDIDSKLANRILKRHPNGFLGATIAGERGAGKSMYAYQVMAKVYYEYNGFYKIDDEESAYDMALDHMIFDMKDLIMLIHNNIKKDYISPVITLDDATVHFCSYKFFTNRREVVLLLGLFDTIRTAVTGLLLTTPNRKMLLNFLRNYDDYKIKILMASGDWRRYARAYRWNYLPDEKKFHIIVPFQDNFSCYVKNKYYDKYMIKRKNALRNIDNEMLKILDLAEKFGKKEDVTL